MYVHREICVSINRRTALLVWQPYGWCSCATPRLILHLTPSSPSVLLHFKCQSVLQTCKREQKQPQSLNIKHNLITCCRSKRPHIKATTAPPLLRLTRQVDEHPSLLVGLRHTGFGSLQLSSHLFNLPKQQVAQTLKHDCLCCQVLMTQVLFLSSTKKKKAVAAFLNFLFVFRYRLLLF